MSLDYRIKYVMGGIMGNLRNSFIPVGVKINVFSALLLNFYEKNTSSSRSLSFVFPYAYIKHMFFLE